MLPARSTIGESDATSGLPAIASQRISISPVSGSSRWSGPVGAVPRPKLAMTMRPRVSMLIPFGAPPALPMRRRVPSERSSAQALAWSEAQTRPSRPTTTSSGRLRPTPTFLRLASGIWANGTLLRDGEAAPLDDRQPCLALPDDLVGGAGRELALDRLRRLASHQHALDEQVGSRLRDLIHRGPARRCSRRRACSLVGLGFLGPLLHGGMLHHSVSARDGVLHETGSKPQSNVRRTSVKSCACSTSSWVLRANGWAIRVSTGPCVPTSTRPRLNRYSRKRRASCSGVREPRSSVAAVTSKRRASLGASTIRTRPSRPKSSALSESRRV